MRDTYDVRGHDGGRGATDRPDRHRSTSTVVQVAPSDRLAAPPVAGFAAAAPIAGGRCSPWRRRAVVFVIASLAVLSACSGADDAVAPGNGPTIPDGTYEKTVTREEAVAAGVPVSFLDQPDEFLGIDEFHITIRLQDGHYQFLANYVGGTQVGDRGTYTYDASGRLVKTSSSSGCPGCTAVFDWSFEEDALVLEVSEDGGDYPDWTDVDRAITRVYDAGTFQRTD